jgi:histidinol-phosphate aminotransferase
LAVSQTFSKAYGMAAVRLGKLFASEELINWINKIKPPYNINQLTQQFVLEKLKDPSRVKNEIEVIISEREKLIGQLKESVQILHVYPSDSNFILVKVTDADKLYNYLIENVIVVRNRSNQPLCENTLRLTIGTPDENTKLLELLTNF